jgi:hypothetical protein
MVAPFIVIHDPRSLRVEQYYVADKRLMKFDLRRGDGSVNMPNSLRVEHGGARVSQFYTYPETAINHRDDANRQEMWSACPDCITPANCDKYRNCDRAARFLEMEIHA